MDTQNFQDLGNSPTQNPFHNFQTGEFAQSPDVSPVATRPAALGNQLPIDDALLSKAVASFLELELTNVDSMVINSFFHGWGLGKSDTELKQSFSEYYRESLLSTFPHTLQPIESDLIIPVELPVIDVPLGQAQFWICPHCHDDAYHQSDENGCEWQYKQDALDAIRYRWLKEQDIALIDLEGVFGCEDLSVNPDDLDNVIDKAMEVHHV